MAEALYDPLSVTRAIDPNGYTYSWGGNDTNWEAVEQSVSVTPSFPTKIKKEDKGYLIEINGKQNQCSSENEVFQHIIKWMKESKE